jgi:hypothetical protein
MKIFYMGKRIDSLNPNRDIAGRFTSFKASAVRLGKLAGKVSIITLSIYAAGFIGSMYGTPTIVTMQAQAEDKVIEIPPVLKRIAKCESNNQQFLSNGDIVRGKINHNDIGKYQINELIHYDAAKKINMDIFTEKGNESYALYLYNTQGTEPWTASKKCWNK